MIENDPKTGDDSLKKEAPGDHTEVIYSGLPSVEYLEQYEKLLPGITSQILHQSALEQEHRHEMDKMLHALVDEQIKMTRRGLWFTLLLNFLSLGLSVWAMIFGSPKIGIFLSVWVLLLLSLSVFRLRAFRTFRERIENPQGDA